MRTQPLQQKGFTIIEVLVVLGVVSALVVISLGAASGVQLNARGSVVLSGLRQVEKSLYGLAIEEGNLNWWEETDIGPGSANPSIDVLIAQTRLQEYLQEVPDISAYPNLAWAYDSDGDTYDGCSANGDGVNIIVSNMPAEMASYVDSQVDDSNASCGKVRWLSGGGGTLVWSIDADSSDLSS